MGQMQPTPCQQWQAEAAQAGAPAASVDATQGTPAASGDAATQQAAAAAVVAAAAAAVGDVGKPVEGAKPGEQGKPVAGVPEAYEIFKMPEGIELDADINKEFSTVAKELRLDQATAQKVADLGGKMAQKWASKQFEVFQATQAQWLDDAKHDKEFGGDKLNESLAVAKATLTKFATPEFTKFLNETGLGNHPEMIRIFTRINKLVSEDKFVGGRAVAPASDAKVFFPNSNHQ